MAASATVLRIVGDVDTLDVSIWIGEIAASRLAGPAHALGRSTQDRPAVLARRALVPAPPAVIRVVIDVGLAAVGRVAAELQVAVAIFVDDGRTDELATLTLRAPLHGVRRKLLWLTWFRDPLTRVPACSAVVVVFRDVDAIAVAVDGAGRTAACAVVARDAIWALVATKAAIVRVAPHVRFAAIIDEPVTVL